MIYDIKNIANLKPSFTFKNIPSIKMTSVSDEDNVDPLPAKSSYLSSTIVLLILFYLFSF